MKNLIKRVEPLAAVVLLLGRPGAAPTSEMSTGNGTTAVPLGRG